MRRLASNPSDSNLSKFDEDDRATFGMVVQNLGGSLRGAFDVQIKHTLPPGTEVPGVGPQGCNLRVTDGQGYPIAYQAIGAGLFDPDGSRGPIGADASDGSNIVVITYDLKLDDAAVLQSAANTATNSNDAKSSRGPDFSTLDPRDDAVETIAR